MSHANDSVHTVRRATRNAVAPSCGVYVDLCDFKLWRPLPDGRLEPLGQSDVRIVRKILADFADSQPVIQSLIDFAEAARLIGVSRKTLYEKKRTGKLRREQGLRMVGRLPRLDKQVFFEAVRKGELF